MAQIILNLKKLAEEAVDAEVKRRDLVAVVRCKDCKWSNNDCSECLNPDLALGGDYTSCLYIEPNWFCHDGKQKEKTDVE